MRECVLCVCSLIDRRGIVMPDNTANVRQVSAVPATRAATASQAKSNINNAAANVMPTVETLPPSSDDIYLSE